MGVNSLCRGNSNSSSNSSSNSRLFACMREEADLEVEEKKRAHQLIEKSLKEEKARMKNRIKVLLLGCGEAGKSTFIKQMKIIHSEGGETWNTEQKEQFRKEIQKNIIECIQILLEEKTSELDQGLANSASKLLELDPSNERDLARLYQYRDFIQAIWEDPAVQEAYKRRSQFCLPECCRYFLSRIEQVTQPDFQPAEQDILQIRIETTGVVEYLVPMKNNGSMKELLMIDVGGQRSERKKWIHCFADVLLLMFLTAASEYDQNLKEDHRQNRMRESLDLFKIILSYHWFSNSSIALFLNKKDLLEEKIQETPLEQYFPGFATFPNYKTKDYGSAMEYIKFMFVTMKDDKGEDLIDPRKRSLFVHETCATDTDNIRRVFKDVKVTVLDNVMRDIMY